MSEKLIQLGGPGNWAPQACTLPTAEQPVRVAEFAALFSDAVRGVERPESGRLRLVLDPAPATAGRAAELAARETGCCSFFTFTLTATAGSLTLDVTVGPAHLAVLDALAEQAVGSAR